MKSTSAVVLCAFAITLLSVGCLFGQSGAPQDAPSATAPVAAATAGSAPAGAAPANTTAVPPAAPAARRVRFVPVLLSATDASGNPIIGLTKEQITVMDTSQAVQPMQLYKASDVPLHLGIVLLASPATFSQQQAAALDLISKVIRPNVDEAFVVTARGKKSWPTERLEWQRDPAELTKIIQSLDRNAGLPDAFNFEMKTDEVGTDEDAGRNTLQTFGASGVNVFTVAYSMMASDPRPSRRVLVMFREPWAHSPGFGNRANTAVDAQMTGVIGAAQETHIATFVIGLEDTRFNGATDTNIGKNYISLHAGDDGGAGSSTRSFDREMQSERTRAYSAGKTNIQRLAAETGGATYWSTKKNYSDAVKSIANQLAGQYLVTFAPRDLPSPVHPLQVISASGGRVLAQAVFFAGPAN